MPIKVRFLDFCYRREGEWVWVSSVTTGDVFDVVGTCVAWDASKHMAMCIAHTRLAAVVEMEGFQLVVDDEWLPTSSGDTFSNHPPSHWLSVVAIIAKLALVHGGYGLD